MMLDFAYSIIPHHAIPGGRPILAFRVERRGERGPHARGFLFTAGSEPYIIFDNVFRMIERCEVLLHMEGLKGFSPVRFFGMNADGEHCYKGPPLYGDMEDVRKLRLLLLQAECEYSKTLRAWNMTGKNRPDA